MSAWLLLGAAAATAGCGGTTGSVTDAAPVTHHLVSIAVGPPTATVASGLTQQYQATGLYDDGSRADISAAATWASSDAHVAALSALPDPAALATTGIAGSALISATLDGITGSATLTVTAATVMSIGVTPTVTSIATGLTRQFTATAVFTDASTHDVTAQATWTSSATNVATVSNFAGSAGSATAAGAGATTVTAAFQGVSGTASLTVTAATLVSVAVTPASPTVPKGTAPAFIATGLYTDNTHQDLTAAATWNSSTPAIATVSNTPGTQGKAAALTAGSTTLMATVGGISGTSTLTVTPATLVSIAVTAPALSFANGTQMPFTATGTYTDATTLDITAQVVWASSATGVVTISNAAGYEGQSTGTGQGTAALTAAADGIIGTANVTVTPATLVSIAITPAMPVVITGAVTALSATGTYTDATTQNLTAAVTWQTSDTTIASVSNATGSKGSAAGIIVGTVSVTATLNAVTSPAVTLTVNPVPEYAYVANLGIGSVSQYSITADGSLVSLSTPQAASGSGITAEPTAIAIDPAGQHAYVANNVDGTLSQYAIGTDGSLTPLTPATVPTGMSPTSVTLASNGLYVFVTNEGDDTISQYVVGADGTLSAASPATLSTTFSPHAITLDSTATHAYVADASHGMVWQYAVASGVLTPLATPNVTTPYTSDAIVLHPSGAFAYVVNRYYGTISEYDVGSDGSLTTMTVPFVNAGTNPTALAVDPTGHFAYAANFGDGTVSQFTIGTDGSLTANTPASVPAGAYPSSVSVDPRGGYAYVTNEGDGTISQYSIGTDGTLTLIGTSAPIATPSNLDIPYPIAIVTGY